MNKINDILRNYSSISLGEMDDVKLMNRVDEKYVFEFDQIYKILNELSPIYNVLEVKNTRLLNYQTTYFDTENFLMYNAHQNGKKNRYKIRKREYIIDNQGFLEIKFKSNKGKTIKKRIPYQNNELELSKQESDFIKEKTPFNSTELKPVLTSKFSRITLVHKLDKERITLDLALNFENFSRKEIGLPFICIAEIKRERMSINSDFFQLMKKNKIRPLRVSKYCIGTVLLNEDVKYNRFKKKLLKINKHSNGDHFSIFRFNN